MPTDHGTERESQQHRARVPGRGGPRHAMRVHQVRHAPKAREREQRPGEPDVREEARPRAGIAHDFEQPRLPRCGGPVRGCGKLVRRGEPHVLRPVVHDEPAEDAEDHRHQTGGDEHGAPRYHGHQPRERRRGQDRAHVAEEDRHAGHRGELALAEPLGDELQQRDEHDRHAEPDQGAADRGHGEASARRRRPRDPTPAMHAANGDDAARAEPVDEHAGRDLHHGVDVEVGRRRAPRARRRSCGRPARGRPRSPPARRDGRRTARRRAATIAYADHLRRWSDAPGGRAGHVGSVIGNTSARAVPGPEGAARDERRELTGKGSSAARARSRARRTGGTWPGPGSP